MKEYKYEIVSTHSHNNPQDSEFPPYMLGNTLLEAEQTFNAFESYINNIADMYATASNIDKEELFGDAVIALGRAKRDFNPSIGHFIPYAKFLILDSMNECVRRNRTLIKVPSYVSKSNIIINRVKRLSEEYIVDNHNVMLDDVDTMDEIPADIKLQIHKDRGLLCNAAMRAGITYEELIERAEFTPLVIFEHDNYIDKVPLEVEHESVIDKMIVNCVLPLLTKDELSVANLLMSDMNRNDISKILKRSDDWVLNRMKGIKTKITRKILTTGDVA